MTVTLELRPEEVAALSAKVTARGVDVLTLLHDLVAHEMHTENGAGAAVSPAISARNRAAIALLDSWDKEDETDDEDEFARRDTELAELKVNLNRWRTEEGLSI
jgi:hypothetical protein